MKEDGVMVKVKMNYLEHAAFLESDLTTRRPDRMSGLLLLEYHIDSISAIYLTHLPRRTKLSMNHPMRKGDNIS